MGLKRGQKLGKRNPLRTGRPTSYKVSMVDQTRDLILMGYTHKQVADFYNVAESSIYLWKIKFPDFSEALNTVKDENDSNVVRSLHDIATGYNVVERKKETDDKGNVKTIRTRRHVAPNIAAIKMWLYNRRPEDFKPEAALSARVVGEDLPVPPLVIKYEINAPVRAAKITIGKDKQ